MMDDKDVKRIEEMKYMIDELKELNQTLANENIDAKNELSFLKKVLLQLINVEVGKMETGDLGKIILKIYDIKEDNDE